MTTFFGRAVFLCLLLSGGAAFAQKGRAAAPPAPPAQTIKLSVDATRAPEKLLHATMQIPVRPGLLTLAYPKWIPGEHGPTGPIADLTGLQFYAGSQRLTWQRDLAEMYSIKVNIPQGATTLEARLDMVLPAPPEGFSSGASTTTQLALVSWNQVLLYPADYNSDDITVTASLKLPSGWHYDTALIVAGDSGNDINFR